MNNNHVIIDPVWGELQIDDRFFEILKCIKVTKNRRQLGLFTRNKRFMGGKHTRYEHSIGTAFYCARKLIDAYKRKFSYFSEITQKMEDAFILSALFHDVGHGPYSHAFERLPTTKYSHEEKSIMILKSNSAIIDEVFEEGVCDLAVRILEMSYKIKKDMFLQDQDIDFCEENFGFMYIFCELLSGAIDVDRIDYIARDLWSISGEFRDFTEIFDYMEMNIVNNKPRIVFSEEAIEILEDYFLRRFRNYSFYLDPETNILDEYFKWFLVEQYKPEELEPNLSESKIDKDIDYGEDYETTKAAIAAKMLKTGNEDNLLKKSFTSEEFQTIFMSKLKAIIEPDDYYFAEIYRKCVVYDKSKNSVMIRKGDIILDFSDASKIIKDDIFNETRQVIVDLELLRERYHSTKSEKEISSIVRKLRKLFSEPTYEIEKKYTFEDDSETGKRFF